MKHANRNSFIGCLLAVLLIAPPALLAQATQTGEPDKPMCDEPRALGLVQQQVELAKTLDNPAQSVPLLIRAADLLWLRQEEAARAILTRAYDLAEKHYQEKGNEVRQEGRLRVQASDQRFAVISAVARRDAAWARKLYERAAEETKREAERAAQTPTAGAANSPSYDGLQQFGSKVINLAYGLLASDEKAALAMARSAFAYPLSYRFNSLLFRLAETNRPAADLLYRDALSAYAKREVQGLFDLALYPFALARSIGNPSTSRSQSLPPTFSADAQLQQLYLNALLMRAQESLKSPVQFPEDRRNLRFDHYPDAAQIFVALSDLEPAIAAQQPDFANRVASIKATLAAYLPADFRQQTANRLQQQQEESADNQYETSLAKAETEANPNRRDDLLAEAVMEAPESETAERLADIAARIESVKLREQILGWLFFEATQKAIRQGDLREARLLAEKVEQLDQRAYLLYQIASVALTKLEDRVRATEALDDVVAAAKKAPNSKEKARTQLGITHLFAKFDSLRAFEVLEEAVHTLNQLENPDLSQAVLRQSIEAHSFTTFRSLSVEGFRLENSFTQLAPLDFERALNLAQSLRDKLLRGNAVLALAAHCLESIEKAEKEKRSKAAAPKDKPSESEAEPNKPKSKKPRNPNA